MLGNLWFQIRAFFPRRLPTGMTQFNEWVRDIIRYSGLPTNDSIRRTAAGFIFSLRSDCAWMSLRKVSAFLIVAASREVAAEVGGIRKIKEPTDGKAAEPTGTD